MAVAMILHTAQIVIIITDVAITAVLMNMGTMIVDTKIIISLVLSVAKEIRILTTEVIMPANVMITITKAVITTEIIQAVI